jgi:hypothetical protein
MSDLQRRFENSYTHLIKAVRRAAYPLHPEAVNDYASNADGFVYNSAPATLPIFVLSPFSGEMSQSTQRVVEKLQSEGDKAVFWLDTSGWLSPEDFDLETDGHATSYRKRSLNGQGNRKVAVFLHAHLCRYLARDQSQCPFLTHEAYTGRVYVPTDVDLDKVIEDAKVKRLKALFWPEVEKNFAWRRAQD